MLLLLFVKKGGFNFGYLNLSLFKSFKKSNVELPLENKTDFGFKINLFCFVEINSVFVLLLAVVFGK